MVTTILRSEEFWASRGRKVPPAQNVVAALRILDTQPVDWAAALTKVQQMASVVGHVPRAWIPPDGYPDVAAKWRSSRSLLRQWEIHLGLAGNWWPDAFAKADLPVLYGGTPADSGDAIYRLGRRLTGGEMPPAHRAALQTFLDEAPTTPMDRSVLRSLLPFVVALILDGPHHALR